MKERDFLNYVIDVARRTGWKDWHVPAPMRASGRGGFVPTKAGAGLPDLILLHADPPRLIFAEVKGDGGTLKPEQEEFLRLARGVAEVAIAKDDDYDVYPPVVGVYVWKPGDQDAIETILKSKVLT